MYRVKNRMKRSRSSIPLLSDFRGMRNNWNAPKLENSRAKNIGARAGTFDGYEEARSRRERGEIRVYCPANETNACEETDARLPLKLQDEWKKAWKIPAEKWNNQGFSAARAQPGKKFLPPPSIHLRRRYPFHLVGLHREQPRGATFVVSSQSWKIRTIIPGDGLTFALN